MYETIPPLEIITAKDLLTRPAKPIKFIIDKILPCGLFVISGSAKTGKSFMMLDMCDCIANGEPFWGNKTMQGDVLYLALEDNTPRLQERLNLISAKCDLESPYNISLVTRVNRLDAGLSQQIGEFLEAHPKTSLIIVDTLQYVRKGSKNTGSYSGDYNDMDSLREIIYGKEISMIVVSHNHKPEDVDPINRVYGSAGLTGAVDGIFILEKHKRTGDKAKFIITNRDTESHVFEIMFNRNTCRWEFLKEVFENDTCGEEMIFESIGRLLGETKTWRGTPTELSDTLVKREQHLRTTPVGLSRLLKSNQEYLEKKYQVGSDFTRNKSERIIILWRTGNKFENGEPAEGKFNLAVRMLNDPAVQNSA